MDDLILLNRTQCPECFNDMEVMGLMDESVWEGMTVPERAGLCQRAGLTGKHGGKSYDGLEKLSDEELLALCDYHCNWCGTDWKIDDLLTATTTPHQVEVYMRQHKGEVNE